MGNSNLKTFLMILVSLFEIRASKNPKKAKYLPKMTKIEISDLKLFDYIDYGEHEFSIKSVNRTFFLEEMGLQKREIRQK